MVVGYRRFQTLLPASVLHGLIHRQASGCLQVASSFVYWSIYLDQGRLTFATNSVSPFERLERQLLRLSDQVPALRSPAWRQLRLLYSRKPFQPMGMVNPDYSAIEQLVQRRCLTQTQAAQIIEQLAQEVLATLVGVRDGSYEVIDRSQFESFPDLCHLDLATLLDRSVLHPGQLLSTTSIAEPMMIPPSLHPRPEPSYRIACIDDSPSILQVIRSFLSDREFDVVLISDPLRAPMQIVRSKPDLILLDVGMPNLDGYELCAILRRHPSFKHLPIVMVTGHTGFIDRAKAKIAGASGYLTKPFTQAELQETVTKHLVKRS
jgi:twitching motility two-component system response regulator PilG